ncbi:unnamed protein product [Haemonchus placei]|uniref:Uncharacterized protein n=1 Tax=Haemonchus placei TaxID=6290 RepID=A0A3P7YMC2_HAEPC|nr:unnamed protein product [Haemonchus placei]
MVGAIRLVHSDHFQLFLRLGLTSVTSSYNDPLLCSALPYYEEPGWIPCSGSRREHCDSGRCRRLGKHRAAHCWLHLRIQATMVKHIKHGCRSGECYGQSK